MRGAGICAVAIAAAWLVPGAAVAVEGERALELVTPAEPVSASVQQPIAVSADGNRVAYGSLGPMPGGVAGDAFATNLASRGALGWTTTPVALPYTVETAGAPTERRAFSGDLLTSIWTSTRPLLPGAPPAGELGLYRRDGGGVAFLATIGATDDEFVGVSDSAERVFFSSSSHLLPSDAGRESGESIYEAAGGGLRQVDVDDSGAPLSPCGSAMPDAGAISRGGERAYFLHPDPAAFCDGETSRVYLREGDATVEASASRCSRPDCDAPREVDFAGATPDGRFAYLVTEQQLLDEDVDDRADLYRYDADSDGLALLSGGDEAAGGAVISEPVLAADDGGRAYFRSQGALTDGDDATDGGNLYLATGTELRFVAPHESGSLEISADGAVALLDSPLPLAGGDGDGRQDVYRYDAVADEMTPVSFGPGFGGGEFDAYVGSNGGIFEEPRARSLAADGSRVAFATDEPLVAADANDALDVYEAGSAGPVLLSGGRTGVGDATLAGVSGDGRTILLRTAATLLGADRDGGELDLYAARIGGGFPEAAPPGVCAPCRRDLPPSEPFAAPATTRDGPAGRDGRLAAAVRARRLARELTESGRAVLAARVPAPGPVSVRLLARRGKHRLLAAGRAGAARRGPLRIVLVATAAGRRRLSRSAELPALLELQQGRRRLVRPLLLPGAGR